MTTHLTHTGFWAGVPLCLVDKATAAARGDSFVHAGYGPPWLYGYGSQTCADCLNVWYAADPPGRRSWTLRLRPAHGLIWGTGHNPHDPWILRHHTHLRDRTRQTAAAALIPPLPRAHIDVTVHTDDPDHELETAAGADRVTITAILEGLADAHVVPTSQPEHSDAATPTVAALPADEITPFLAVTITETAAHDPTTTAVAVLDQAGGRP